MKKSIIGFSTILIVISISAFAFSHLNEVEESISEKATPKFFYDVDSRFAATISKEDLHNAISVIDIIPKDADWASFPIHKLTLTLLNEKPEPSISGNDLTLNDGQLQLLRSTDYSDDFKFIANCKGKHKNIKEDEYDLAYFLTIIPELEAEYIGGKDAVLNYLKENSKAAIADVDENKLQSGKISFTINTEGEIEKVFLDQTSGYVSIDGKMLELINNLPGKWEAARNSKNEKVDQLLVFSFGQIGC